MPSFNPNDYFVKCDQGHDHWGAEGAAGLMLHHQDANGTHRYLMQQRSPWVEHGMTWAPAAGALAPGETPQQGAVREFQEEHGAYPMSNPEVTHVNDHGGWQFHTVTADSPTMFDPEYDPNEIENAAWLTPEEIDEMPLHPGFQESWNELRPTSSQRQGKTKAPAEARALPEREETGNEKSSVSHKMADSSDLVKGDEQEPDEGAQILDHLTMKSVAHNLHYKYEQAPLTTQEATEYAARLLDMIGYRNPDAMTISTALNAWHQLYPEDRQLEQGPAVQQTFEAPPTVPSQSWGYSTSSAWQERNATGASASIDRQGSTDRLLGMAAGERQGWLWTDHATQWRPSNDDTSSRVSGASRTDSQGVDARSSLSESSVLQSRASRTGHDESQSASWRIATGEERSQDALQERTPSVWRQPLHPAASIQTSMPGMQSSDQRTFEESQNVGTTSAVTRDQMGQPSIEPWQPGTWGKGLTLDGKTHMWETEGPGGFPHHQQYLKLIGQPAGDLHDQGRPATDYVTIAPDGSYTGNPASATIQDPSLLARTQPGMRYMPDTDRWNMRAFSAVSAPPVPELYHWTDASNLHDWMDDASTGPGSTYLTEHGDAPDDESWNPDVPMMMNPVRLTIDHNQLDPDGWDDTYHGWLNNYLYHGAIPKSAIKGVKAFPPADSWDMPEHWAKRAKTAASSINPQGEVPWTVMNILRQQAPQAVATPPESPGFMTRNFGPILPKPVTGIDMAVAHTGQIPGDENLSGPIGGYEMNPDAGVNPSYIGQTQGRQVYVKPAGRFHPNDLVNERAAFGLSRHFGVPVPHTVVRDIPSPDGYGGNVRALVQQGIEGAEPLSNVAAPIDLAQDRPDEMRRLTLFDHVIGNYDRHLGNAIQDQDGKIWAIDHSGAFMRPENYEPHDDGVSKFFNGESLTPTETQMLEGARDHDFKQYGLGDHEIKGVQNRIQNMLDNGAFPGYQEDDDPYDGFDSWPAADAASPDGRELPKQQMASAPWKSASESGIL